MDKKEEYKRRAARLVAGTGGIRDLEVLFLWLRERPYGNWLVQDVGHFAGHSDKRDRGTSRNDAKNFAVVARHLIPRGLGSTKIDRDEWRASVTAALEMQSPSLVRRVTGMHKNKAQEHLKAGLSAVVGFCGKKPLLLRKLTQKELRLLKMYDGRIYSRPAFTDDDLYREFVACLQQNGLIDRKCKPDPKLKPLLALYAVEKMHSAELALDNGETATLKAGVYPNEGNVEVVGVAASVPTKRPDGSTLHVAFAIYLTNLDPAEWCTSELQPVRLGGTAWNHPLEIGSSGKLRVLH